MVSAASFLGRICDNDVNNSESMTKHTAEKHDKAGADKTSDNDVNKLYTEEEVPIHAMNRTCMTLWTSYFKFR